MPQAIFTHTRKVPAFAIATDEPDSSAGHDAGLRDLCQIATTSLQAMLLVYDKASELNADDPARAAMSRVVDHMQLDWQRELRRVTEIRATCPAGIHEKAKLLEEILDIEADSLEDATPAVCLAASLVSDLLRQATNQV